LYDSKSNSEKAVYLSVVVPIFNESESLGELSNQLQESLEKFDYEIFLINDGSTDNSWDVIKNISANSSNIHGVNLARNYGQTAAINAGIQFTNGKVIILIDSDLENNPQDIPKLIQQIENGYDVASGWRKGRWKNSKFTRRIPSKIANWLISKISGVKLHDYGCTLKAYNQEVIKDVKLYGQMHRFIPIFCKWKGGKITEVQVSFSPRKYGKNNYGIFRIYKVILDLIFIVFLDKYQHRPIHFFGGLGLISFFISFLSIILAIYFKFRGLKDFVETPLPIIGSNFFLIGIVFILIGIIAEIQMRTYFESQGKLPFQIKETTLT
jgi:glycosyltransferase involved in cell wall biosynthesis